MNPMRFDELRLYRDGKKVFALKGIEDKEPHSWTPADGAPGVGTWVEDCGYAFGISTYRVGLRNGKSDLEYYPVAGEEPRWSQIYPDFSRIDWSTFRACDPPAGWVEKEEHEPCPFEVGQKVTRIFSREDGPFTISKVVREDGVAEAYRWKVYYGQKEGQGEHCWDYAFSLRSYVAPEPKWKFKVNDLVRVVYPYGSWSGIAKVEGKPYESYHVRMLTGDHAGQTGGFAESNLEPYTPLPGEKVCVELTDGQKVRGTVRDTKWIGTTDLCLYEPDVCIGRDGIKSLTPDLEGGKA